MVESLRTRLPVAEYAAAGRVLRGRIDAARLAPRVGQALARPSTEGELTYELVFAPAPGGAVALSGELHAQLMATCQRCLRPFEIDLEVPVRLLLTDAAEDAVATEGWEIAACGTRPTLADVIEEELLLALPFLPRHAAASCPAASPVGARAAQPRRRPFAGLDETLHGDGD